MQITFRLVTAFEYKRDNDFGTTLNIFERVARRVPAALRHVRCHIRECDGERGPTGPLPSSAKEFVPDIAKLLSRGRYQTISPGTKLDFSPKIRT